MPIAKITGQGLAAIALSTAALWCCLITERNVRHDAMVDRARILHDIERLQKGARPYSIPASTPVPAGRHRFLTTVG